VFREKWQAMKITIEVSEPAEFQQLMKWLNDNQFVEKLAIEEPMEAYRNTAWVRISESALDALWNNQEEDYWDELYAKQHPGK
jgi:hypothetical protein